MRRGKSALDRGVTRNTLASVSSPRIVDDPPPISHLELGYRFALPTMPNAARVSLPAAPVFFIRTFIRYNNTCGYYMNPYMQENTHLRAHLVSFNPSTAALL